MCIRDRNLIDEVKISESNFNDYSINYKPLHTKVRRKEKEIYKKLNKIEKIILNMGLGEDASDSKKIKACQDDLALIAGQKPVITKFKKSISNFKT